MRQPRISFLSLLAVLCLIAAACGSTAVTSTAQEVEQSNEQVTVNENSEAIDLSVPINEQDLDQHALRSMERENSGMVVNRSHSRCRSAFRP